MAARLLAAIVLIAGIVTIAVVTATPGTGSSADRNVTASTAVATATAAVETTTTTTTTVAQTLELDNYGQRKDLVGLDGWLNTSYSSIDDFAGKVLLVEMWTFGCHNCKARIPHNQALYAATSRDDFDIIGVHAPEFDFEAEIPNIEDAVDRLGVTWPVALDTQKQNFRAWQEGGRRFWPRTFIIDRNGDIRYDHIGEGRYDEVTQAVQHLIADPQTTTS